jgi:cell wall assembly regulator SMI1
MDINSSQASLVHNARVQLVKSGKKLQDLADDLQGPMQLMVIDRINESFKVWEQLTLKEFLLTGDIDLLRESVSARAEHDHYLSNFHDVLA